MESYKISSLVDCQIVCFRVFFGLNALISLSFLRLRYFLEVLGLEIGMF